MGRKKRAMIDEEFDMGDLAPQEFDEPMVEVTKDIQDLTANLEQEPCLKFGKCEHYGLCSEFQLACTRFMTYCSKGTSFPPDENKIYKTGKKANSMGLPTRAIYKTIFPNCDLSDDEPTQQQQEEVMIYGMQE
jgi:hypothetical protein